MLVTPEILNNARLWYNNHRNNLAVTEVNRKHYLCYSKFLNSLHIIYGMDDPQRYYLALTRFHDWFIGRSGSKSPSNFRHLMKQRLPSLARQRKDKFDLVSNYVLDLNADDVVVDDTGAHIDRSARSETAGWAAARETARQGFTDRFKDSHFAIAKTDEERRLVGAQKNRPRLENLDLGSDYTEETRRNDMKSLAIRRACKYLMYESIANGKTVVYCLDDLDLGAVANALWAVIKTGQPVRFGTRAEVNAMSGYKKVPICTSEIRELFRCWDYFKTPLESGLPKVQFMRGYAIAPPPWETNDQRTWADYGKEQADKYFPTLHPSSQSSLQRNYDAIATDIAAKNYVSAIRNYHSLGIGVQKRGDRRLPAEA